MGRPLRIIPGGYAYHVFNRANAHVQIFSDEKDYLCFEKILFQACDNFQIRLCTYCIMPNHWHLVVWPEKDNELSKFMVGLLLRTLTDGMPLIKQEVPAIFIRGVSSRFRYKKIHIFSLFADI